MYRMSVNGQEEKIYVYRRYWYGGYGKKVTGRKVDEKVDGKVDGKVETRNKTRGQNDEKRG